MSLFGGMGDQETFTRNPYIGPGVHFLTFCKMQSGTSRKGFGFCAYEFEVVESDTYKPGQRVTYFVADKHEREIFLRNNKNACKAIAGSVLSDDENEIVSVDDAEIDEAFMSDALDGDGTSLAGGFVKVDAYEKTNKAGTGKYTVCNFYALPRAEVAEHAASVDEV